MDNGSDGIDCLDTNVMFLGMTITDGVQLHLVRFSSHFCGHCGRETLPCIHQLSISCPSQCSGQNLKKCDRVDMARMGQTICVAQFCPTKQNFPVLPHFKRCIQCPISPTVIPNNNTIVSFQEQPMDCFFQLQQHTMFANSNE